MYRETYSTARGILGFLVVMGWISVGVGAILFLVGLSRATASPYDADTAGILFALMPGIALIIAGLTQVALAQVGFAVLDQADISRATLGILRNLAERAGVETHDAPPTGVAGEMDAAQGTGIRGPGEATSIVVSRVGGRKIYLFEDGTAQLQTLTGEWKRFASREEAEQYIS